MAKAPRECLELFGVELQIFYEWKRRAETVSFCAISFSPTVIQLQFGMETEKTIVFCLLLSTITRFLMRRCKNALRSAEHASPSELKSLVHRGFVSIFARGADNKH